MEIILTVKNLLDDKAILQTAQQEELVWPKSKLPDNIREGETLYFTVLTKEKAMEEKNKKAKDIINEILDTQ